MIQNVLRSIGGVGSYGVISICLFFAAFLGVVIWSLRLKKPYMDGMRSLPLENDAPVPPSDHLAKPGARHE
jgi:cytochrome c oxidase cbb3-type subunit IV